MSKKKIHLIALQNCYPTRQDPLGQMGRATFQHADTGVTVLVLFHSYEIDEKTVSILFRRARPLFRKASKIVTD